MSRIGNKIIEIPQKVKINISGEKVKVSGPLGELEQAFPEGIIIEKKDNNIIIKTKRKNLNSFQGLTRAILNNMVLGVSKGIEKTLEIVGTGYKAELNKSGDLKITVGFSHPVMISSKVPEGISPTKIRTSKWIKKLDGIEFEVEPNRTVFKIKGIDKQVVGQMTAMIRRIKPPEPYKGKGIKYKGEYIKRKAGKSAISW